MRLLLDQNLSHKLCFHLSDIFPGSSQVRLLGMDRAEDLAVWRRAAADGYCLVTQDVDFKDLAAMLGTPPKVILLRCGNQPTAVIERLLRAHADIIRHLERAADTDVLEIAG